MIDFNNVQIKNAMNVAFMCCMNEGGGVKPVYFKVGYKSELGDTQKNVYIREGDGGAYPRIFVNILENVKLQNDGFVDLMVNVLVANTYLRDEKGNEVEKSEVEGYNDLYKISAKFWGYLRGLKHKKNGSLIPCFKMGELIMENDGYKITEEILVVESKFSLYSMKPKEWDCMLRDWGVNVPGFLVNKYNPESEKPFPDFDIEKYVQ